MDLSRIKKVYIIGIEGAGTSALAQILKAEGFDVGGSDNGDHFYGDVLKKNKIKVYDNFAASNVPRDTDAVIYSSSFNDANPEIAEAKKRGVKLWSYAEALGYLFNRKYGIAVCGSHGKTTTTAWLAFVLDKAGLAPSALVGSKAPQLEGNVLIGKSRYFVVETDEYQNKLKFYNPKAVLLNNIDYDHPDFFKSREEYKNVFAEFIKKIPQSGFLIANFDDPAVKETAKANCRGKVISYALKEAADYVAYDIKISAGRQFFKVKLKTDEGASEYSNLGDFAISLFGRHNVSNALSVIAAGIELGVELFDLRKYLEEFAGTARRMEAMGEFKGAKIVNDYAHHPTEIKATLAAAQELYAGKKIIAVFHPHTFSRTEALLDDFAAAFGNADEIVILEIFGSVREEEGKVTSRDLVREIQKNYPEKKVNYVPDLDACEKYLRENIGRGDVIMLMGAGDVYKVGKRIIT